MILVVVFHWYEMNNINMLILINQEDKLFLLESILGVTLYLYVDMHVY